MTAPWLAGAPLGDLTAIPVHIDPEVPAGTAVLDHDPDEPRHITGIRVAGRDFALTDEQTDQIRDHYQAMNERAGRVLAWWNRTAPQLGLWAEPPAPLAIQEPILNPHLAAVINPRDLLRNIRIT